MIFNLRLEGWVGISKLEGGDECSELLCPKELSVMKEIFHICAVQYDSHKSHVTPEHLKCVQCD